MSYDYERNALWYRTYKVASRTIDNKLKTDNKKYIYGSMMGYSPWMFNNFLKFAFVRNPESRFISAWKDKVLRDNWFKFSEAEHEKMKVLDNFISWVETLDIDTCDEHVRSQNSLVDLNNVDFIGRFENFATDFTLLLEKLNIEPDPELEHRNKGLQLDFELTDDQRWRIYRIYEKDFRILYPDHKNTLPALEK